LTAYWLSKTISKWVIPDRFYAAFPYGMYDPKLIQPFRKQISSRSPFCVSYNGQTIKNNEYLGFTFDGEDFKKCRQFLRKEGTGEFIGYDTGRIPIEERWSARFFELDKVFKHVNIEGVEMLEIPWYYNIGSWDGLCNFFGSEDCKKLDKPFNIGYHTLNTIGKDNEEK
jgi:hypothetical protein